MFSGIIEDVGTLRAKEGVRGSKMIRFVIGSNLPLSEMKVGDSLAVNGACLTILETDKDQFLTEVSPETAQKTNLTFIEPGEGLNLERGLKVGERFNGHIVLGHVDSRISRLQIEEVEDGAILWLELPGEFARFVIKKGSIALNGVSLTVNEIESGRFSAFLIPHTIRNTNLLASSSASVNLEVDMIGKYIEQFTAVTLKERI